MRQPSTGFSKIFPSTAADKRPASSKQTVRALRYLSWSLQHGRPDHGLVLSELDRTDIVRFTTRLAYLERSGEISSKKRYVISTRVRRFLDDVRAF